MMLVRQIGIDLEVEQIEVTLGGILPPYKASTQREFVPGLSHYYFVIDGERVCEVREDQAAAIRNASLLSLQRQESHGCRRRCTTTVTSLRAPIATGHALCFWRMGASRIATSATADS